jgi:hypothetical protein
MNEHKERLYKDIAKYARNECIEEVCRKVIVLLQHRNELLKLMRYLVDLYTEETFWDRSIDVTTAIIKTIDIIQCLNKRRFMHNPDFQNAIARLVYLCVSSKTHFHDFAKFTRQRIELGRLENKLENVLMCREAYSECKIVTKLFRNKMTIQTAQLFDALYHFMRREDKKTSLYILIYICQWKDISFVRVPNTHELFDDLKEECTADIAWYIWWFLITYVDTMRSRDDRHALHWHYASRLLEANFNLFKCLYIKKTREIRISILQCMLIVILSLKMIHVDSDDFTKSSGVQKIQELMFNDFLIDAPPVYKVAAPRNHKIPDKVIKVQEDETPLQTTKKKDTNFLNCIIYNDIEDND